MAFPTLPTEWPSTSIPPASNQLLIAGRELEFLRSLECDEPGRPLSGWTRGSAIADVYPASGE